jgi:anaerobic selenocysteine-containing dehydrogenase
MIERAWYDRSFIHDWSNGPFLVRTDTGRLITERDLINSGSEHRYLAWDTAANSLVVYDPTTCRYEHAGANLALEGEFQVATVSGTVRCRSTFALYAELCRQYSPEVVEAICWIDREQLKQAADLIWNCRPTAYYAWSGHEQYANATQTARAISLVHALTGSFDVAGGNVLFPSVPTAPITGEELPVAKTISPALGAAKRPLGPARWNHITSRELYTAILEEKPYPIRGLVGFGANILVAHIDALRGREALSALDFYAHADMFMNPTAEFADLILPVASPFEREVLKIGFEVSLDAQSLVQLRPPVVDPLGESKSDVDIVFNLAKRLGLDEYFWDGDIDAAYAIS